MIININTIRQRLEELNYTGLSERDCVLTEEWSHFQDKSKKTRLLDQLTDKYLNNPLALEQIDIVYPDSHYTKKRIEFICALKTKDKQKEKQLDRWFARFYPYLDQLNKIVH